MKRVYINDEPKDLYFNDHINLNDLLEFLNKNHYNDNIFSKYFNEQHSCTYTLIDDLPDFIMVSGDEDYKEITLQKINTINLKYNLTQNIN